MGKVLYMEDIKLYVGKGTISPLNESEYGCKFDTAIMLKETSRKNVTDYPFDFIVHGLDSASKVKFSGMKYQRILFSFHKIMQDLLYYIGVNGLMEELKITMDDFVVGFTFGEEDLIVENIFGIDCFLINVDGMNRNNYSTMGLISELIDLAIKGICFMNFQEYDSNFIKAQMKIKKISNWYLSEIMKEIRPVIKSSEPHTVVDLYEVYEV